MSRVVTQQGSIAPYLSSYDTVNKSYYSLTSVSNAYSTDLNSTANCTINLTRGAQAETYIYFKFDTSAIPAGATILSVACQCVCRVSNTTAANVATRQVQMASGLTLKGSATNLTTTITTRTLTPGTWTRAELADARVRLYAKRGTSNVDTNYTMQVRAAQLTVTYEYEETYYTVTIASNTPDISVSPASQEYLAGADAQVAITGDITNASVTDNGADVKYALAGTSPNYTYSIQGIAADHTIVVTASAPPAGGKLYVKQNGAWEEVMQVYTKSGGAWAPVKLHYKENGDWITT